MTDAEYLYQKNREQDRARSLGTEPRTTIGKVWVQENAITRMGALCFIRKREPHHEMAAERFKSLYEARYGHGNTGSDPSKIQVDKSNLAHDNGMAAMLDRTVELDKAKAGLSTEAYDRLVAAIILEIPVGEGFHWRNRSAMIDLVLSDLDTLSVIWKLRSRDRGPVPGQGRTEPECVR
jgi:hypothetical protein